ncbi:hypothetical protein Syun_006780 [Stephania yunnanensis]|uniref:Uncharacterized protein n=1 Tax=Stephania yunnanensis TaxID=152371 RepID=A0AAP0L0N1_9MAGN
MSTPWSVFQDGRMGAHSRRREHAVPEARRMARASHHDRKERRLHGHNNNPALAAAAIRVGPHPESIGGPLITVPHRPRRIAAPIRFPPDNFKHSLTLFSKSFSSFPRALVRYRLSPHLALDGIYRPIGAAFPNNPTR